MPRNDKTGPGMLLCLDDDGAVSWLFRKGRIRLRLLKLALRTNQMIIPAESYPCYPGYTYPCGNPKPLLIPLLRPFQNVIQTPYKSVSRFTSRSPQTYNILLFRIAAWNTPRLPLKLYRTRAKASMIWDQQSNVKATWFTPQEEGMESCVPGNMVMGCSRAWKEAFENIQCSLHSFSVRYILWRPVQGSEDNSRLPQEVWVPCAQFYHFKLPVGGRNSKIIFKFTFFLRKVLKKVPFFLKKVCQIQSWIILPHLFEIRGSERMVCEGDG